MQIIRASKEGREGGKRQQTPPFSFDNGRLIMMVCTANCAAFGKEKENPVCLFSMVSIDLSSLEVKGYLAMRRQRMDSHLHWTRLALIVDCTPGQIILVLTTCH